MSAHRFSCLRRWARPELAQCCVCASYLTLAVSAPDSAQQHFLVYAAVSTLLAFANLYLGARDRRRRERSRAHS